MFLVKVTVLLTVLTVIYKYIVAAKLNNESIALKMDIVLNNKYPAYYWVFAIMVVLDMIGIIYSVVWFLFLR